MTRRISTIVSIGLLVLLSACGGGGGGGGGGSTPDPPPPVDTTPNSFAFTAQSGTALSAVVASNEILVSGISAAAAVSITGGEYSINGGAFTSAAGTVTDGQRIQVRVTSPNQFSTPANAVLTVGGVSATFTATTLAADTTPDAFAFTSLSGTALSTVATSNEIVVSGINTGAAVTITGGEYSINGGAFTAAGGTVFVGQAIRVRVTGASVFSTSVSASLAVGGVSATFTATTLPADTVPDAIQFARKSNGVRGAWVVSDSVTIAGINTSSPVTIDNGEYSLAGGAFTSAAGSIGPGQSLIVRTRASSSYSTSTRARVTVGTVSADFEVSAEMPDYIPDVVAHDGQNTIYLLSSANGLVFRWSISEARYLDPYPVTLGAINPTSMAYSSAHQRVYVGYNTGAIRYVDVNAASPVTAAFATMTYGVSSLSSAGNFLLAQTGNYNGGYILNSSGGVTGNGGYYYGYSRETAWDPATSRIYYTRDGLSPNDLHYDVIDQATGQISSTGETPYHGSYSILPPIRVSQNSQFILLGSGDIYSRATLSWSGSLGSQVIDARWLADGSIVTLTGANNQTLLRRLGNGNLGTLEQRTFAGDALRVVGTDTSMTVVVINDDTVQFHTYVPSDDSDGDGVTNTQDAFPLDAAASVDTDHDGYPDAWNAGRSQADSTTGLTLDAFARDSACWLAAHGSGGACNYGATIPNYFPDEVVQHGDVIYLLSSANQRVYRWSISGGAYLNPYIVGLNQGYSTIAPTTIEYSAAHQRLYVGYGTGAIRYIDVNSASAAEVAFASMPPGVLGLTSAGNFLAARAGDGYYINASYILNSSGVTVSQGSSSYYFYANTYEWDPVTSRLYFVSTGSSYALYYEVINQVTGAISSSGSSSYNINSNSTPPARVSADGQTILLGSGAIYSATSLDWTRSLGLPVTDARWFANGSVATLITSGNQTMLRRLGSNLAALEERTFTGEALRVVGSDAAMVVLTTHNGAVQFHNYVPSNDNDGDGVLNPQDAFPFDAAASADTDGDGYPNSWNAGRSQADSTTGLTLDAFAQDSGCWLVAHGSGGICNPGSTVPNYVPDKVTQQGDVVYLLSGTHRRVYRWSISAGAYLNPYVVGIDQGFSNLAPTSMAHSASHHRLYLGYSTGLIRYIDTNVSGATEVNFHEVLPGVLTLTSTGNFLLARIGSVYSSNNRVLDSSGAVPDEDNGYYYAYAYDYSWDPVTSRLYFTNSGYLYYNVIDQVTGEFGASGNSAYSGITNPQAPIRVSVDGQYVLLGSGDFYTQSSLMWSGSVGTAIADARWFADGSFVTLITAGGQTTLRHVASNGQKVLEQRTFTGEALRVVGSDTSMAVVVTSNGAVQIHGYVPNDDVDADGVLNTVDAFPMDRAASVDTDGDGYPDAWNPGRNQADSTTGLTLDAYSTEFACWLLAHGSGGVCDFGATMPDFMPDQVAQQGDVVYLLSTANKRVYRWSMASGAYLRPYVIGSNHGYNTLAPTVMAYSPGHLRLYLGYSTGAIRYIDVNGGAAEVAFATMPMALSGLSAAGNFLLATVPGGYNSGYVLNNAGATSTQSGSYDAYPRETTWDPVTSRIYYVRSGLYLHYEVIDQATGLITSSGDSPYDPSYSLTGPVRVNADGSKVLLASGFTYTRSGQTLTRTSWLGKAVADAHWKDNLLVDVDTTDRVEIRDANSQAILATYQYLGQPVRVLFGVSEAYLLHIVNGRPAFVRLPFYDQDGDTIARWWEQLYSMNGAGMSDANAADATTDLDSDGVNNLTEYLNLSNPTVSDTDGDGLSDSLEIVTHHTSPNRTDTDGDGLSDHAEVITHHSNPLDTDSDDDDYSDLDEVLYGGDPNDPSGLPQPLINYSQTFEGSPNLAAWTTPPPGTAPWTLDTASAHSGSASLKSSVVGASQTSSVKFRGFFTAGELSFWARVDSGSCCNRMRVYVDGTERQYISYSSTWNRIAIQLTLGIHEIEWRFERDPYETQTADVARIDDVVFVGQ